MSTKTPHVHQVFQTFCLNEPRAYWGIGDFLRGCLALLQMQQTTQFDLTVHFRNHPIGQYILDDDLPQVDPLEVRFYAREKRAALEQAIRTYSNIYILTNLELQSAPTAKSCAAMRDRLRLLRPTVVHENVLHVRMGDSGVTQDILQQVQQIASTRFPGWHIMTDVSKELHSGLHGTGAGRVYADLCILAHAQRIHQLSVYPWGSSFSRVVAEIYGVPLSTETFFRTHIDRALVTTTTTHSLPEPSRDGKICILFGNCQVAALDQYLCLKLPHYRFVSILNYVLIREQGKTSLPESDLKHATMIVYQPLHGDNHKYETMVLDQVPASCTRLSMPYVYNDSLWPLLHDDDGRWHNRDVIEKLVLQHNLGADEIVCLYKSKLIDWQYAERERKTMDELRRRELATDLKASPIIDTHRLDRRLFFTQNHPSSFILCGLANQILFRLHAPLLTSAEVESFPEQPIGLPGAYPLCATAAGFTFNANTQEFPYEGDIRTICAQLSRVHMHTWTSSGNNGELFTPKEWVDIGMRLNEAAQYVWLVSSTVGSAGTPVRELLTWVDDSSADFMATHVEAFGLTNRDWWWWHQPTGNGSSNEGAPPLTRRWKCFNPLMRVSRRLLVRIIEHVCTPNAWRACAEILVPTLAAECKYSISPIPTRILGSFTYDQPVSSNMMKQRPHVLHHPVTYSRQDSSDKSQSALDLLHSTGWVIDDASPGRAVFEYANALYRGPVGPVGCTGIDASFGYVECSHVQLHPRVLNPRLCRDDVIRILQKTFDVGFRILQREFVSINSISHAVEFKALKDAKLIHARPVRRQTSSGKLEDVHLASIWDDELTAQDLATHVPLPVVILQIVLSDYLAWPSSS